eukprot:Partr_v1_DN11467_c0_g1_i1_m44856
MTRRVVNGPVRNLARALGRGVPRRDLAARVPLHKVAAAHGRARVARRGARVAVGPVGQPARRRQPRPQHERRVRAHQRVHVGEQLNIQRPRRVERGRVQRARVERVGKVHGYRRGQLRQHLPAQVDQVVPERLVVGQVAHRGRRRQQRPPRRPRRAQQRGRRVAVGRKLRRRPGQVRDARGVLHAHVLRVHGRHHPAPRRRHLGRVRRQAVPPVRPLHHVRGDVRHGARAPVRRHQEVVVRGVLVDALGRVAGAHDLAGVAARRRVRPRQLVGAGEVPLERVRAAKVVQRRPHKGRAKQARVGPLAPLAGAVLAHVGHHEAAVRDGVHEAGKLGRLLPRVPVHDRPALEEPRRVGHGAREAGVRGDGALAP